jgi:cytochrome b involved in lipid metabolism
MTNIPLHQLVERRLIVTSLPEQADDMIAKVSPLTDSNLGVKVDPKDPSAFSASISFDDEPVVCDACQVCQDVCDNAECQSCRSKAARNSRLRSALTSRENKEERFYTPCQIRRHNHAASAWLVAGDVIYDATPYLSTSTHPGGSESILKRAGGAQDCSRDLQFHSALGKRMFKKFEIGRVRPCCSSSNCTSNTNTAAKNTVHTANRSGDPTKQWWSILF